MRQDMSSFCGTSIAHGSAHFGSSATATESAKMFRPLSPNGAGEKSSSCSASIITSSSLTPSPVSGSAQTGLLSPTAPYHLMASGAMPTVFPFPSPLPVHFNGHIGPVTGPIPSLPPNFRNMTTVVPQFGGRPGFPPSATHHLGMKLHDGFPPELTSSQALPPGYFNPAMAALYPYGGFGSPLDLNGARRKNATRETTGALKAWLFEHRKNPYPTKGEKIMLAIISKMTLTQVSTWFANARRRLKKENKMTWSPRCRSGENDDDDDDDNLGDRDDDDIDVGDRLTPDLSDTASEGQTVLLNDEPTAASSILAADTDHKISNTPDRSNANNMAESRIRNPSQTESHHLHFEVVASSSSKRADCSPSKKPKIWSIIDTLREDKPSDNLNCDNQNRPNTSSESRVAPAPCLHSPTTASTVKSGEPTITQIPGYQFLPPWNPGTAPFHVQHFPFLPSGEHRNPLLHYGPGAQLQMPHIPPLISFAAGLPQLSAANQILKSFPSNDPHTSPQDLPSGRLKPEPLASNVSDERSPQLPPTLPQPELLKTTAALTDSLLPRNGRTGFPIAQYATRPFSSDSSNSGAYTRVDSSTRSPRTYESISPTTTASQVTAPVPMLYSESVAHGRSDTMRAIKIEPGCKKSPPLVKSHHSVTLHCSKH